MRQSSVPSPSAHSSVAAVEAVPVRGYKPAVDIFVDEAMPPYASPATPAQRRMRRDLGWFGPLSAIQQFQLRATRLAASVSESEAESWLGKNPDPGPITKSSISLLGVERWDRIHYWRYNNEKYDDWDKKARREYAEASLYMR